MSYNANILKEVKYKWENMLNDDMPYETIVQAFKYYQNERKHM